MLAPVHHHPDVGFVLSLYADIEPLLRDERFGVATPSPLKEGFAAIAPRSMRMISENMLLFIDPPNTPGYEVWLLRRSRPAGWRRSAPV